MIYFCYYKAVPAQILLRVTVLRQCLNVSLLLQSGELTPVLGTTEALGCASGSASWALADVLCGLCGWGQAEGDVRVPSSWKWGPGRRAVLLSQWDLVGNIESWALLWPLLNQSLHFSRISGGSKHRHTWKFKKHLTIRPLIFSTFFLLFVNFFSAVVLLLQSSSSLSPAQNNSNSFWSRNHLDLKWKVRRKWVAFGSQCWITVF